MEGTVLQLNIGKSNQYIWNGKNERSAIGKQSVRDAFLTKNGFIGDDVEDTKHHGGPDRAVCLYPFEHYSRWEDEFNVQLMVPAFGENLTVKGLPEKDVNIGDVFQLGEAVIEVSLGRVPCSTISKHNNLSFLLKRVFDTNYTGYFFRVLEEGKVTSDAKLILKERVQQNFSVFRTTEIILHEQKNKDLAYQLLEIPQLAVEWREKLVKRLF